MKKQVIVLLMLITSITLTAQRHRVIQKEFDVDKNSSIVLNLDNISVAFEESTDGKIHFDYVMEFDGYSKKKMKTMLEEIEVEVMGSKELVSLKAKSKSQIAVETMAFNTPHGISINDIGFKTKKDSIIRKSKDSLLREINLHNRLRLKNNMKYFNERFKMIDENGKLKNITKGSFKLLRSEFVIKLPPFVRLTINAKSSNLYFRNDTQNELSIISKDGSIKAKSIANAYNKIEVEGAGFEAIELIGGDYTFKNVFTGKIGEVSNAKINSEFSKIEIGEIGKQTKITDFNSEYWFYNWYQDFERFNLYSEYSKIHLFYPKTNHSMKTVGNNTKHIFGKGFEANLQPTRNGEKFTMMTKAARYENAPINEIHFDIIHGIIYTHEDSIKHINKD